MIVIVPIKREIIGEFTGGAVFLNKYFTGSVLRIS